MKKLWKTWGASAPACFSTLLKKPDKAGLAAAAFSPDAEITTLHDVRLRYWAFSASS
jgi:hypothetical protein